jgi:hypothetical protein
MNTKKVKLKKIENNVKKNRKMRVLLPTSHERSGIGKNVLNS